jgi:AcrR family transcriptional regulator
MNIGTRERLLLAATRLFADSGYRGASVRDICNQAGANPGAISYHFGGKRQLYRSVLRQAAAVLAEMGPANKPEDRTESPSAVETLGLILRRLQTDDTATRLLLRDLADGGAVAVESLTPPLRSAFEQLNAALGEDDNPRGSAESRLLFLELAAPMFLLAAAWPVVARALDLQLDQREALFTALVHRALARHRKEPQ